jgi:ABC-type ATPase with predicted acetyltransferase domain
VDETLIKTSDQRWLERLARAYKERLPVSLVDDADVGIDPSAQTIFQVARSVGMSSREKPPSVTVTPSGFKIEWD